MGSPMNGKPKNLVGVPASRVVEMLRAKVKAWQFGKGCQIVDGDVIVGEIMIALGFFEGLEGLLVEVHRYLTEQRGSYLIHPADGCRLCQLLALVELGVNRDRADRLTATGKVPIPPSGFEERLEKALDEEDRRIATWNAVELMMDTLRPLGYAEVLEPFQDHMAVILEGEA